MLGDFQQEVVHTILENNVKLREIKLKVDAGALEHDLEISKIFYCLIIF